MELLANHALVEVLVVAQNHRRLHADCAPGRHGSPSSAPTPCSMTTTACRRSAIGYVNSVYSAEPRWGAVKSSPSMRARKVASISSLPIGDEMQSKKFRRPRSSS